MQFILVKQENAYTDPLTCFFKQEDGHADALNCFFLKIVHKILEILDSATGVIHQQALFQNTV